VRGFEEVSRARLILDHIIFSISYTFEYESGTFYIPILRKYDRIYFVVYVILEHSPAILKETRVY